MQTIKVMQVLLLTILFWTPLAAQENAIGVWQTIDDETGEAKSHIQIFEKDGKLYGKVIKLLQADPGKLCDQCPGDKKDQPILGMQVLSDLQPYRDYWSYGRILDPQNGKTYKCSIWLEDADHLKVRGYIGVSALGRSQDWYRVK